MKRSKPPLISWLLACITCCGFLYLALYSARNTGEAVRDEGLTQVQQAAAAGDLRLADEAVGMVAFTRNSLDELSIPPFLPLDTEHYDRTVDRLREHLHVANDISSSILSSSAIDNFLYSLPLQERRVLKRKLKVLKDQEQIIRTNRIEITKVEKQVALTKRRWALLVRDFRYLLNLEDLPEGLGALKADLYSSGLLKGLPKVPEILSPPSSPSELRDRLLELELPLPSIAPEDFAERLETLRLSLGDIFLELKRYEKVQKQRSKVLQASSKKLRQLELTFAKVVKQEMNRDIALIRS